MIVSTGQLAVEPTKERSCAIVFSDFYYCVFFNFQLWSDQRIVVYE